MPEQIDKEKDIFIKTATDLTIVGGGFMALLSNFGYLVLGLVVILLVYYINRVITLYNRVKNAWAQIDVQLKKRADLVPNLVETVKGYAKHEKGIMVAVTQARAAMMGATTIKDKAKADNMLASALKSILALAENYPALRANENFKLLQEQLDGIESKIAFSRQFYNDSVLDYDNFITIIPGVLFARMLGKQEAEYFRVEEKERALPKVKFE